MHSIAIDGGRLAFADAGSGMPVVLIHGFPLDHSIWDVVTRQLEARARILRPDLRGLGGSSVTPGPYLMETLASDVAAMLDALGIESAILAGHSLGGYVAMAFYRMYPERVAGLALVASRVAADAPHAADARRNLADRVERDGIAPVVESFLPRLFAAGVYGADPALVARTRALVERTDPSGAAAILRGMALRVDANDLLEEIDVPFRLVVGDADPVVNVAESESTVRKVRGGKLDILGGVGHLPMLESPQRLIAALDALLDVAR